MTQRRPLPILVVLSCLVAAGWLSASYARRGLENESLQQQRQQLEAFRGVTTGGTVMPGLFGIRSTGVTTEPVRLAAQRFLQSLDDTQRKSVQFAADDPEWRLWNNIHRYDRQGISFRRMSDPQRQAATGLFAASLSAKGLRTTRDIMRLNGYLADLIDNHEDYGEDLYYVTVMGEPSATEPWGWQLDGHHLIINYFVLGDQVVMTPTFLGSEPVIATEGRFAGTAVLQDEDAKGLAFIQSLDAAQRKTAIIDPAKTGNNALAQAFRDNLVLDYAGLRGNAMTAAQKKQLLDLVSLYVSNMDDGHARIRKDEVATHIDDTHFAWIGGTGDESVFYYRIQSPVILIEFDHEMPVALRDLPRVPSRKHIHAVVRTPNGNDYGKDLLRQHYEAHRNDPAHGHTMN
jgi:hypothetical protein